MAASSDPTESEVINTIKKSLDSQKLSLITRTGNAHNRRDLSRTFLELNRTAEYVVKANYGQLQYRCEFEQARLFPMLERVLERAHRAILRRLSPRMSKLHPWLVCFDVSIPKEVFALLKKVLEETSYGLVMEETSSKVTVIFTKLRRIEVLFNKFVECNGLRKELKGKSGIVKVIIDSEKKGVLEYLFRDEIVKVRLHYGYWNEYGVRQH